ncbi:hypothetical protein AMATHDRAFT_1338 [Amanita thiersii Skay4041]|uniref:Carboxypeptidase n=1 Tax=Amanita thiersii Skay4041 TaxID=703135 RepID=A0A2A9NYZ9_9AGAR|nr:hypothetical protein AMATHDRAFT_1338 [Amanita thiersii Skay4041]
MLLSYISALAAVISVIRVNAGQIPVVNGVIGGVSNATASTSPADFKIAATTPGQLRVVENSGICETTPGVFQASGYGDLTSTKSIWFWYFAARNNPSTAPLALWFNGGPGSSSMIGLLQEHGPCRITNDSSSVTLNPHSWNNEANILYIDQPVGVGFSHGTLDVGTSQQAAADVWKFMQIFLNDSRFTSLQGRKLAIWTESYGGHYGPTFAAYFLSQNAAIDAGTVSGLKLNLQVLGVGDGLTETILIILLSHQVLFLVLKLRSQAREAAEIKPIQNCYNTNSNSVCSSAQSYCNNNILSPLAGVWDVYYVLTKNPDPYPPSISSYLNSIASQIGAETTWKETNSNVYSNFAATGDWMRNSRPNLETVINANVRTIVFDGDADYILNFDGVEAMVDALQTQFTAQYHNTQFQTYAVQGQTAGQFKNAGTFSYIRIYGAGHEVPAYEFGNLDRGQAAAQMFTQIMADQSLTST